MVFTASLNKPQRADGTWRAQVYSKGQRLSYHADTKAECITWIQSTQTEIGDGWNLDGAKTTIKAYATTWLNMVKSNLRTKTIDGYKTALNSHILPGLGQLKLVDLTTDQVDRFYINLQKAGVGVYMVRLCHRALHVMLEKAVLYNFIMRNPTNGATVPKAPATEMSVLDEEQVTRFLTASSNSRYEPLFRLAVTTGMRQAELLGLKWTDISWQRGVLYLRRQAQWVSGKGIQFTEPKTKAGKRTIRLSDGVIHSLQKHKVIQDEIRRLAGEEWGKADLVFPSIAGTTLDASNLRKEYYAVLAAAGLPKIRFHDLRHYGKLNVMGSVCDFTGKLAKISGKHFPLSFIISLQKEPIMMTQKTIEQLVKGVLEELNSQGYSQGSIQRYSRSYQSLMEYTNSQGITQYSEGVGLNYVNNQYGFELEGFFGSFPKPVSETLHHLLILWHYQQYSSVTWVSRGKKKPFICPENYKDEYESFQNFCELKKYTTLGLPAILNPVKNFLLCMESHHVHNLKDISQDNLSVFLSIYAGNSVRYRATIVSALRNFLKLLSEDGSIPPKIWQMLPNVRYSRNAFIPPSWKKEDVKKLLDAVDRGNPRGKRDYALLLLVVRLGLRASDIRNLKLHNIEWKNKKIVLIQKKTKQTLELPLLEDIGWALIDYLKNGRPKTKSDAVFINHKAPYGEFKDTNGMQQILWKYMRVAGLERPKNESCGLHSLRSTLARTMLEVGTPLPIISEVLGHESIQTTSIYLKINLEALRKCPIDPEEVFLHEQ